MIILPRITIPTPFGGSIHTAALETPPFRLPRTPDSRSTKIVLHGLGMDVSGLLKKIPVAGDIIGDMLADMHAAELRELLSDHEDKKFTEQNKLFPASIAAWKILALDKQ